MLRFAASLLLLSAAPAFAASATASLRVGIVITPGASGLKTTRYAAAAAAPTLQPLTSVSCEGSACVKTIYY